MSKRSQYSLFDLLALTGIISGYLGIGTEFVRSAASGSEAIFRANLIPPLCAISVVAFLTLRDKLHWISRILIGIASASGMSLALSGMFVLSLQGMGYWDWRSDWWILLMVMVVHAFMAGIASMIVIVVCFLGNKLRERI